LAILLLAAAAQGGEDADPTLASYARAREILAAAVAAHGGADALRELRGVRRAYFDTWLDPMQGARPWRGEAGTLPPANAGFDRSESRSFVDYDGGRPAGSPRSATIRRRRCWRSSAIRCISCAVPTTCSSRCSATTS
jgi:hypothetical protein